MFVYFILYLDKNHNVFLRWSKEGKREGVTNSQT